MSKYCKSLILQDDLVLNTERDFGETKSYYQTYFKTASGELVPALFTQDQLDAAIVRAGEHPEDVLPSAKSVPFLLRFITWE